MTTKKDTTYTKPVDNWLTQKQITMALYPLGKKLNPWTLRLKEPGAQWYHAQYKIVFQRDHIPKNQWLMQKELVIPCFTQSKDGTDKGHKPTAYDALCCLTKSDPGSFENFCSDFGYDEDSRKAESTYKAVVAEWEQVSNFFSSDELEQLQEIAQ